MRYFLDKNNGKYKQLTDDEVLKYISPEQLAEGIEAKLADPNEEVCFMTDGGYIRISL